MGDDGDVDAGGEVARPSSSTIAVMFDGFAQHAPRAGGASGLLELGGHAAAGDDDDEVAGRRVGVQPPADLDAVEAGISDVDDQGVGFLPRRPRAARRPRCRRRSPRSRRPSAGTRGPCPGAWPDCRRRPPPGGPAACSTAAADRGSCADRGLTRSAARMRRWPPGVRKATMWPSLTHFFTELGLTCSRTPTCVEVNRCSGPMVSGVTNSSVTPLQSMCQRT